MVLEFHTDCAPPTRRTERLQVCGPVAHVVATDATEGAEKKNSGIGKLREMVDAEMLHIIAIELVSTHFSGNPHLPEEQGTDIIRNMVQLYRNAEDMASLPWSVGFKITDCINALAVNNSGPIRTELKNSGLLDVRDHVIVQLLRTVITKEAPVHIIRDFAFDSIAEQSKFRDGNGLLFLLSLAHDEDVDEDSLFYLWDVIRHVFAPIEENRKIISRILLDEQVCQQLGLAEMGSTSSSSSSSGTSSSTTSDAPMSPQFPNDQDETEELIFFLDWYESEEGNAHREQIVQRIHKMMTPILASWTKTADKASSRKMKKLKSRITAMTKLATVCDTKVSDWQSKRKTYLTKAVKQIMDTELKLNDAIREQYEVGEEQWFVVLEKLFELMCRTITTSFQRSPHIENGSIVKSVSNTSLDMEAEETTEYGKDTEGQGQINDNWTGTEVSMKDVQAETGTEDDLGQDDVVTSFSNDPYLEDWMWCRNCANNYPSPTDRLYHLFLNHGGLKQGGVEQK
eukprot:TRINITY_DN3157_c0_g1_i3.p2 TRINITY_DN3157_c0_g1~~TRINITY_DN3157_c0_g1_i3.p2  ORF type:complete len:512 (-),score=166.92 TRINITY_DN3157_c0_g1_i3:8-1543(-)